MLAPMLLGQEAQSDALLLPVTVTTAAVQTAARRLLGARLPSFAAAPPLLALMAAGAVSRVGLGLPNSADAPPSVAALVQRLLEVHPGVARLFSFLIVLTHTRLLNNAAKAEIRRAATQTAQSASPCTI